MKPEDIRELGDADIAQKIEEAQEEIFRLRFRSATQMLENPMLVRTLRRDIARMKTILRERQLEQVEG
ncbi:MAG: 50S ribosomal protein L29 [Gemmatimonadota bacterium]